MKTVHVTRQRINQLSEKTDNQTEKIVAMSEKMDSQSEKIVIMSEKIKQVAETVDDAFSWVYYPRADIVSPNLLSMSR